jgi:hypothetical protein
MSQTIDVTGLPEPVVQDLQKLVATLRENLRGGNGSRQPARDLSAEEWIARFRAWADSHPKRAIVIDDSREAIYSGRGE